MTFRQLGLPYCLHRCRDGRWLVLNRDYKPVGVTSKDWVDYETFPGIRLRLTKTQLRKIHGGIDVIERALARGLVYLYHDGCIPAGRAQLQAYMTRLAVLLNREHQQGR